MTPRDWHVLAASEVIEAAGSNAQSGLSRDEAARRLAKHGPNTLPDFFLIGAVASLVL